VHLALEGVERLVEREPEVRPAARGDELPAPRLADDANLLLAVAVVSALAPADPDVDQVVVPGRERAGREGALVVTPLRTARGVVPVVRGWVPAARAAVPAPPAGRVTVRGVLQRSETEADATTVVPREGEVGYVATVTLLAATAYDPDQLYDGFVVLRSTRPALADDPAAPAVVAARQGDDGSGQVGAWRNLAYAVQWWLFAAAAVFFWAAVLRRAVQEQRVVAAPTGAPDAALIAPRRTT